jgi:hypothetical protein
VFFPVVWKRSARWLVAMATLCGCHRAEIGLNDLLDEAASAGTPSGGATGEEATLDVPPQGGAEGGGGAGGAAIAGSTGREGDAGPTDRSDEIAWMLCRDPLDPPQKECKFLREARTCSHSSGPSWTGCAGQCQVCKEQLLDYPYYFEWHPCCDPAACGNSVVGLCHEHCPPPTTRDKVKRCEEESD